MSSLRIHWQQGNIETALDRFQQLGTRSGWRRGYARAALFLAASDLVSGESRRAGAWLTQAARATRTETPEIAYWRGRLAELEGKTTTAVGHYVSALVQNRYHPLSEAARIRLDQPELAAARRSQGVRLATVDRTRELHQAWILLGDEDPLGSESRDHLRRHMQSSSRVRPFLEMQIVPAGQWAIWDVELDRPDEILLSLGIVEHMSPAVGEHFPVADNSLALTASHLLAESGLYRQSLRFSEILSDRLPDELPQQFLSESYRRTLYPIPYQQLIRSRASSAGIEPHLLAAIIREESRFDPMAVSAASARGLTQFVLGTARRYGPRIGRPRLKAADLHRPEVAIALGATYLADLSNRYSGRTFPAIAAYNAGEDQAELWQSYCNSEEPAEYFTKVGFSQTRAYLEKVVGSWLQYDEIYPSTGRQSASATDLVDDRR
jgi:soluble lytic murein transglycosylase